MRDKRTERHRHATPARHFRLIARLGEIHDAGAKKRPQPPLPRARPVRFTLATDQAQV
jgi:hypothetical protein